MASLTAAVLVSALPLFLLAPPAPRQAGDPWDSGCEMMGLSSGGSIFMGNCSPHDPRILTVATDMSGSFITYDAGSRWHTIHFRELCSSNSCAAAFHPRDPDVLYWVRGSELRVSRDRGVTWKPVGDRQPWRGGKGGEGQVVRIWLDPDHPETIFVGTASGKSGATYASDDEGKSWRECEGAPGRLYRAAVERRSPAGRRVYYLGTSEGLFRSDDGGRTFTGKSRGLPTEKLTGFAGGSDGARTVLYVSVPCELKGGELSGGMFRSRDGGDTWERCMGSGINLQTKRSSEYAQGDLPQYGWIGCSDRRPSRCWVYCSGTSYYPPHHSTIYLTDDEGGSWREVFFSDPRFRSPGMQLNVETDYETETWGQRYQDSMRGLEVDPQDPDVAVVVQARSIHYTLDAGKSWKSPHRGSFRVDAEGRKHWTNSGEVVTSTWNWYVDPFDKDRRYICYTDIGFARSLDAGRTWLWEAFHLPKGWSNTTYELAFDPAVKGRVWGAFSASHDIPNYNAIYGGHRTDRPGGIAISDDHGASWRKLGLPVELPVTSVVIDPKSPQEKRTLYASVFGKGVYRSTDGGERWEPRTNGLDPGGDRRCLRLNLGGDGTLFVATTGRKKDSHAGTGVWRSADGGGTWTEVTAGKPWDWIRDYAVKPDDSATILVPTSRIDAGLHRTRDGGKTWETIFRSEKEHYFFGAAYHPGHPGWIYLTLGEGASEAGLYLSKDDGRTWTPFTRIPFAGIQRVAFDPADPGHIYLSTFGSSVIRAPVEP